MADSSPFEEIQWDVLLQDLPQSPKICLDDLGLPILPHYSNEHFQNEKCEAENISSKPPIESLVSELSALNELLFSDDGLKNYTFDANGIEPNEFLDIDSFLAGFCSSQKQRHQDDDRALTIQPSCDGEAPANGEELTEGGGEMLGTWGLKQKRYSSMEADNTEVVSWSSCHGSRKTNEPAVLIMDSLQKESVFYVMMMIMTFLMAYKLPRTLLKKRMGCQEKPYMSRKNRKTVFISFYVDDSEGETLRKWMWCRRE